MSYLQSFRQNDFAHLPEQMTKTSYEKKIKACHVDRYLPHNSGLYIINSNKIPQQENRWISII